MLCTAVIHSSPLLYGIHIHGDGLVYVFTWWAFELFPALKYYSAALNVLSRIDWCRLELPGVTAGHSVCAGTEW